MGPFASQIRLRAFVVGIVATAASSHWVVLMEKVNAGPYPTIISLFANVIFVLAVLALINTGLKRISPRLAFTSPEMLVVYTMCAVGSSLAGHDFIPSLLMCIGHPWRFETPENNWAHTFIPYLPKWLTVSDSRVLKGFYEGHSSFYTDGTWQAWVGPVINWLAFVVVLMFVMMCINVLVRKQWIERERLTFPIVQLPLAMTEPAGALWKNRLFWLGFAIAFGIDLVNGLAVYFPNVPQIAVGFQGRDLQTGAAHPWNAMGWTPYSLYPFVIGLGYLLPADLSFSCWFFYWFWKLQLVLSRAMAFDAVPDFPYVRHQAFGGYVAILVMLTWTGRGYIKQVALRVLGRQSELDDSDEPMSYRAAVAGSLIGFAALALFMKRVGMSPVIAVIAFVIYFVLAIAISRMRAEMGPPVHDLHFSGPDYMITTSGGLNSLGRGDMVGLTYFFWFNRAYRGHPMPLGIEGMKMAQVSRASQRRFFWAVMIAALVGGLAAFWSYLHMAYVLGVTAKFRYQVPFGREAFRSLEGWWSRPLAMTEPNWGANFAMLGGFVFCTLLGYCRISVLNFPFHPIGYAISGSWSMNLVWLPIMIAWVIKVAILRYGGLRLYRTALPFFFGLILGEMIVGCLWTLFGAFFDVPYFSFWGA